MELQVLHYLMLTGVVHRDLRRRLERGFEAVQLQSQDGGEVDKGPGGSGGRGAASCGGALVLGFSRDPRISA